MSKRQKTTQPDQSGQPASLPHNNPVSEDMNESMNQANDNNTQTETDAAMLHGELVEPYTGTYRCGTVAIVGRPNVGKSTLLNALVGQKISITSRKAQTTRHRIMGVDTQPGAQFIFLDTPGFQTQHNSALNRVLNRSVNSVLTDVDVIVWLIEAGPISEADAKVAALFPKEVPMIMVMNKADQVKDKAVLLPKLSEAQARFNPLAIIPMSAKQPRDIAHLRSVIEPYLPLGAPMFDEDDMTDRSARFMAAELIREKVFRFTGDELPYTSTVVIEKFEEEGRLKRIFATIFVNRDSHKAMVIGEKGSKLKQISMESRQDMEKLFDSPVYLEIFVKVKSGWADNEAGLRAYGYE